MRKTVFLLGLIFFTAAFSGFLRPETAFAHPHVFIEQRLKVVFDDNGLSGIQVNWLFDDMFSSMIANDHDLNKNNSLEPEEVAQIKGKAFAYIAEYDYFFSVKIDGTPFPVKWVTDFSAELDQGKLIYDFFIPCHVAAVRTPKKIIIASYDPNYYTAIFFADRTPYRLINASALSVNADVREDKDTLIYFDMVNPWTLFLDFRLK